MRPKRLAWILLPAAIIVLVVVMLVLSNFQKETGIAVPGKGARLAVAAAAEALSAAAGVDAGGYDVFSNSLAVALVDAKNMPVTNPAETRLQSALTKTLDCLSASREAWRRELEQDWDPVVDASPAYWQTLHPALTEQPKGPLSAEQVRQWSRSAADHWLKQALDLVE